MTGANRAGVSTAGPSEAFAPAKVNLCLHITGRRADGYHLLDSLVAFAGVGDRITAEPAADLSLTITGPFAAALRPGRTSPSAPAAALPPGGEGPGRGRAAPDPSSPDDNLVLRAARAFGTGQGARLTLDKHLPVASGIGGGSADAAAALRALAALWDRPLPPPEAILALGADVPVCLAGRACRMTGAGEALAPIPALPPAWIVLANPGIAVSTPAVFAALVRRDNPPLPPVPAFPDAPTLAAWLASQRNDLETPALALAPAIAETSAALAAQPGTLLARMSGSGATCFALFRREAEARAAAAALARPGWWTAAAPLAG
jgi:4-diphosphocytidyl-2-C-methyl-D-erythritol kinase